MAKTAEAAATNGDLKTSPEEYRRAVALSMRHTEYRNGAWTDIPVTDEEVSYLLLKAAEYGLNPLKGQIYATWRSGRIQVETTLEGLRVIAERTGEYQGQLSPEWFDGESGEWTEVWTKETHPTAARWGVLRKGFPNPVLVTVHWEEFKQTKGDGSLTAIWNEKPAHMLAKNAASLAFRAAFPGEAGGIYTAEEMAGVGQAKPPAQGVARPAAAPQAPTPAAGGNGNGNGAGAAAIVDAPASQPSGPPATPATSGRLAAVLEQAGYSRLKVDLAKLVFDQHPDRLSEEETQRLANALTAAESAGITVVELERACKRGVKYQDIGLRRKAFFQWIQERGKKAAARSSQQQGVSAGEAPAAEPESEGSTVEEPAAVDSAEAEAPPPPDDAGEGPAAILDEEPQGLRRAMSATAVAEADGALVPVAPLQVPSRLPRRRYGSGYRLDVLSPASVRLFEKCPEAFRRRYLLGEREPLNLSMLMGSVVGDSLAHFFQHQIDNEPLSRSEVDDIAVSVFDAKLAEAVLGSEDDPVGAKALCRAGVADYLAELAPSVQPISVERRASFRLAEEQEWRFVCFFDLECEDEIPDLKFGEKRVSEDRALKDLQATAYAYCRWAEGTPAGFVFHSGLLEVPEGEPRWLAVPAPRGVAHFRGFEQRIARVARLIVHLDETEPGEWPLSSEWGPWCAPREGTKGCPYWARCPVGGGARGPR